MNTLISIIVPAYNIEGYISNCLDSVLVQTYKDLEIVVVDDGSTDNTAQILDNYAAKDNRIKIIHKNNGGVTEARLCGVNAARGEYIGFIDGDDYVEPQMFERLMANAVKYSADISHCGYRMVFPDGHVDYYYNTGCLAKQDRITALKELLSGSRIEPGLWNKLFHKTLFRSLLHSSMMDKTIKNTEDLLMNFYLFQSANTVVYEDFCPYHYLLRKSSAATSALSVQKLTDPMKVFKILEQETKQEPDLVGVVEERILRRLIQVATMPLDRSQDALIQVQRQYRNELRKDLKKYLGLTNIGKKEKIMASWAAIWPSSYRFVHSVYAKIKGVDKKYNVE